MAALLGPTNESGIKYTLTSPSGYIAVFNDETDPNYVGGLTADEAITGFDSAEIIESFQQRTEDDGALHGSFFFGRRPITMSGNIVPTTSLDRATRLNLLLRCVKDCMRSDGTLSFTPTGGEAVFINVRAQQPPRVRGKWVKEFFLSLVAADPRFYSVKQMTAYFENTSTSAQSYRRFTYSSSSTSLATRSVYIPAGTWTVRIPVRQSAGTAKTITPTLASGTVVSSPNLTATVGSWTEIVRTFTTTNAVTVASLLTLTLNSSLAAAQYIDVGPIVFESASGLRPGDASSFATNWAAGAGYTMSNQTATPSLGIENQGNAPSAPRLRIIGPYTAQAFVWGGGYINQTASYSAAQWAVIDTYNKTVLKDNVTNDYASVGATFWSGINPGNYHPYIAALTGGSTATRYELSWRNAYL